MIDEEIPHPCTNQRAGAPRRRNVSKSQFKRRGKQTFLTRSDIESLPHINVTTHDRETSTFDGAALRAVLEKAGVEFGDSIRGKRLASCLVKRLMATAPCLRSLSLIPISQTKTFSWRICKTGNRWMVKRGHTES